MNNKAKNIIDDLLEVDRTHCIFPDRFENGKPIYSKTKTSQEISKESQLKLRENINNYIQNKN